MKMQNSRARILCFLILFLIVGNITTQSQCTDPQRLFRITKSQKYGYINTTGRIVIKPRFDEASDFSEGLAMIGVKDKYGYIDPSGNIVIKPQFNGAGSFSNGLALVTIPDGTCELCGEPVYINQSGRIVIRLFSIVEKTNYSSGFSEGLASAWFGGDFGRNISEITPYGFIDTQGKVAIGPKFGYVGEFQEGLALFVRDYMRRTGWGFINRKGEVVIEPRFSNAGSFKDGFAHVEVNGKWGFIDKTGKFVIEPQFGIHKTVFRRSRLN